jgi:hypothetical protein
MEFFAWGSDHDVWHPHWLRLLTDRLEAEPNASLAWCWRHIISGEGEIVRSIVDNAKGGLSPDRDRRIVFAAKEAPAGSFLHGLIRVSALKKTSGLRMVLVPDRLLIAELAAIGPFALVPEFLWQRRYFGLASRARQRRSSFPEGAPLYTYLPVSLQHGCALIYGFGIRKVGAPEVSSADAYRIAGSFISGRLAFRREQRARYNEAQTIIRERRTRQRKKRLKRRYRTGRKVLRSYARKLYQVAQSAFTKEFWTKENTSKLRRFALETVPRRLGLRRKSKHSRD